jgi:hypothetical protein
MKKEKCKSYNYHIVYVFLSHCVFIIVFVIVNLLKTGPGLIISPFSKYRPDLVLSLSVWIKRVINVEMCNVYMLSEFIVCEI